MANKVIKLSEIKRCPKCGAKVKSIGHDEFGEKKWWCTKCYWDNLDPEFTEYRKIELNEDDNPFGLSIVIEFPLRHEDKESLMIFYDRFMRDVREYMEKEITSNQQ